MKKNYSIAFRPDFQTQDSQYVADAARYIVECDLSKMTDEIKGRADGLFQDLLTLYHVSPEYCVKNFLPIIEKVMNKFKDSYVSTYSADVAYYLGRFESLHSLYRISRQQMILNKCTQKAEGMNLLMSVLMNGCCDMAVFSQKLSRQDINTLYENDLINIKTGNKRKVTLSRRGRYCLMKRWHDSREFTLKLYSVIPKSVDSIKYDHPIRQTRLKYDENRLVGGIYGFVVK